MTSLPVTVRKPHETQRSARSRFRLSASTMCVMSRSHASSTFLSAVVVSALLLAACGAGGGGDASPPLLFSGPAAETVAGAAGAITVEARWSPVVPVKGNNAVELTFRDDAGEPLDGLVVSVVPWMPAHGHGTAVQPVVMPGADGVQVATPVYLYMSGEWQLRLTMTGPQQDAAIITVQIP